MECGVVWCRRVGTGRRALGLKPSLALRAAAVRGQSVGDGGRAEEGCKAGRRWRGGCMGSQHTLLRYLRVSHAIGIDVQCRNQAGTRLPSAQVWSGLAVQGKSDCEQKPAEGRHNGPQLVPGSVGSVCPRAWSWGLILGCAGTGTGDKAAADRDRPIWCFATCTALCDWAMLLSATPVQRRWNARRALATVWLTDWMRTRVSQPARERTASRRLGLWLRSPKVVGAGGMDVDLSFTAPIHI